MFSSASSHMLLGNAGWNIPFLQHAHMKEPLPPGHSPNAINYVTVWKVTCMEFKDTSRIVPCTVVPDKRVHFWYLAFTVVRLQGTFLAFLCAYMYIS